MRLWQWLPGLVLGIACVAQPAPDALTVAEYTAQLDRLISAAKRLADTPGQVPDELKEVPPFWRVRTAHRTFNISSEWLRRDLDKFRRRPDKELPGRIVEHLQSLRAEAISSAEASPDTSQQRVLLGQILAASEFQDVHGPTWLDRLKQRVMQYLLHLLGRMFRSSAIPAIGNFTVYGLSAIAVLVLAYWIYRTILNTSGVETLPIPLAPSAKEWTVWMTEARTAAESGNWRDAIHLLYWCGISFLEAQGLWRPDPARTPREYLRLLPSTSESRAALSALTQNFELVWYAAGEADAQAFSQALLQLEKLGCRPS